MAANYYEILGISQDASEDDIRKAFRKIAIECHPDKNPGNAKAEERFKEASNAYDVLSNSQKKMQYDLSLKGPQRGPGNPNDFMNNMWSDIFGPFGQQFRNNARAGQVADIPGQNIEMQYQVSFTEAYNGTSKEIDIPDLKDCGACKGSGCKEGAKLNPCAACGGTGASHDFFSMGLRKCQICRGKKGTPSVACPPCNGSGSVQVSKKVLVTIPAGVMTGQTLRLAGSGLPGSPNGDLFLHLVVEEIPGVDRKGLDLHTTENIDLLIFLRGGIHKCNKSWNFSKDITIPQNAKAGEVTRIPGAGFANVGNAAQRGDLYLKLIPSLDGISDEKKKEMINLLVTK